MKKQLSKFGQAIGFLCLMVSIMDGHSSQLLQVTNSNGGLTFAWPAAASNFILQATENMGGSNEWNDLALPTNVVGSQTFATLPATNPLQFFRLREPVAYAHVPIFSFAIFYDLDLEINPGWPFTVNGRVHSNQNIWATGYAPSILLTFLGPIDAAGTITATRSPLDPSVQRSGNVIFDDVPIQNATPFHLDSAVPTVSDSSNALAILNPPPAAYAPLFNYLAAYFGPGSNYLENAVDLIVSNPPSGLATSLGANIIIYYQNPNNTPYINQILPDMIGSSNVVRGATNVVYSYYSFVTNVSFYDYRENDTVQAIQINVAAFNTWLTNYIVLGTNHSGINYSFPIAGLNYSNSAVALGGKQYNDLNTDGSTSKNHQINSIYVYNSVPLTTSQLPAVRMVKGQQLPSDGLTVVTPQPMYVEGNYNTTTNGTNFSTTLGDTANTYPAGLFADAITILSSNWNDALYTSAYPEFERVPSSTTINTAIFQGIVPSSMVSPSHYSGGVENFLRLLEGWTASTTLTYNGSIVAMFPCQYATNYYSGSYYGVPKRAWGFDNNFTNMAKLPPLTPTVTSP